MFKFRIIGFTLLMALLGGIFFWDAGGKWLFLAAAPALVAAAIGECCSMLKRSRRPAWVLPTAVSVWVITMLILLIISGTAWFLKCALPVLAVILILAGNVSLLTMKPQIMEKFFTSSGVAVALAPSLIMLLATYFIKTAPAPGYWLLFLCLVTKATDTGGYIVGTLTSKLPGGNHKIAPKVSPKKSWEGLAGGMLLSLAVSWAFYCLAPAASVKWYIISALVLSLGSFFGDLTESAIKRFCDIKDSGSFVPGMGGAFDVLDSFIYNGLLFWLLYFYVR